MTVSVLLSGNQQAPGAAACEDKKDHENGGRSENAGKP